ncbi:MAG: helix-turn-helix domain-containing protein [Patescibacteria group bacterium]|nr:helix-turn-helix domain-containing protein [Patescibacteria group bacterium]
MTISLLTPKEVAELLKLNILTVYAYIRKGKLNAIRFGRSYRISNEDLNEFIESNKTC